MIVEKGFAGGLPVRAEDKAYWEGRDARRREHGKNRVPMDVVMIHTNEGRTTDIVTGTPPAFKAEARSAWAKRREEASIEGLFK